MELIQIVDRIMEGISYVDEHDLGGRVSRRTKIEYHPGVMTISETELIQLVALWWNAMHPEDFTPRNSLQTEVSYPNSGRNRCDFVFTTDNNLSLPEWGVELKKPALIGDNGKNNDYNVPKVLSPYLKDRSLIHDIHRLSHENIARKKAVVGFMFGYSPETCAEALMRHPNSADRIKEIQKVCNANDPSQLKLDPRVLVETADIQFRHEGIVGELIIKEFKGLWRHPCGGDGVIFAWEVA